ncbi:MAG: hypothetical protein WA809_04875 [Candidatus Dormiibacterota bacterium]
MTVPLSLKDRQVEGAVGPEKFSHAVTFRMRDHVVCELPKRRKVKITRLYRDATDRGNLKHNAELKNFFQLPLAPLRDPKATFGNQFHQVVAG